MESICLDTDILVDFLRNKKEVVVFIDTNELTKNLATTYLNLFELYYGAMRSNFPQHNIAAIDKLKKRLTILNLSETSVKEAGRIIAHLEKIGQTIDFRDLLIGSIALYNGYKIKTRNIKHFNRISGLEIL